MKSLAMIALAPVFLSGVAFAAPIASDIAKKDPVACSETKGCKSCSGKEGHCKDKCTCEKKCECEDCGCDHAKKQGK